MDNRLTSHGGSRNVKNVDVSPVNFDTDGGPTGGVLSKLVDPIVTTVVPKQQKTIQK